MARERATANGHSARSRLPGAGVPIVATPFPAAPAPGRMIDPHAVYRLDELRTLLGLPMTCLRREVRLGRLRVSRRSGRYWTTGAWVHEWLAGGEVRPRRARAAAADATEPAAMEA